MGAINRIFLGAIILVGFCDAIAGQTSGKNARTAAEKSSLETVNNPDTSVLLANNAYVIMDLNYIAANPDLLNDKNVLRYFALINNCSRNTDSARSLKDAKLRESFHNELEYPAIEKYYKSKAPEILARVQKSLIVTVANGVLGEYDTTKNLFPVTSYPGPKTSIKIQSDISTRGAAVVENGGSICMDATNLRNHDANFPAVYIVSIGRSITIGEVPIQLATARDYIESTPGRRDVRFDAKLNFSNTPPKVVQHCPRPDTMCVVLQATVANISVLKAGARLAFGGAKPDEVLATLQP
jgi:hypothetical protein